MVNVVLHESARCASMPARYREGEGPANRGMYCCFWFGQAGLRARTKALMNLLSICAASFSESRPTSARISLLCATGVDAGRLNLDVFETGRLEFVAIVRFFEGASNAAGPQFDLLLNFSGD